MKNIYKYMLLIISFFLVIPNVFATVITCDYGSYVLKFDTLYYEKDEYEVGNDGDCEDEPLCFIERRINKPAIFRVWGETAYEHMEYTFFDKKCPKKIYVKPASDVGFGLTFEKIDSDLETYELVSYNITNSKKVSCGNVNDIPRKIPELTSMVMTMIQIAVPIILVIMGSLDLFKGITAQKEDEIKKGQQIFVKRLIIGALIFFIVVIGKLLISVVADSSSGDIIECIDCFLSNKCG